MKKNNQLTPKELPQSFIRRHKIFFSFCSTKYKTPTLNQLFAVYESVCPGCRANYVGRTERNSLERNVEHAWSDKDSALKIHLNDLNPS